MVNENCPNKKIGWQKCVISLILFNFILFLFFIAILGFPPNRMSFLLLVVIILFIEIVMQIVMWMFEKYDEKNANQIDWKHPPQNFSCNGCQFKLKIPDSIKTIFFKIKTLFGEFLLFYQILIKFKNIIEGWNSAVDHRELNPEGEHDAFIVIIYSPLFPEYMFQNGIDLLVSFFIQKKYNYKIYCCNSSDNFFDIVNKPNVTSLWIFGHGSRGRIRCSDKIIKYSDLCNQLSPTSRNKRFVYQFHCNRETGEKSLVECLAHGRGFANFKTNNIGAEVRGYIKNILQDESWQ